MADNSSSIKFFNEDEKLLKNHSLLVNDDELAKKFNIKSYTFSKGIQLIDSLGFNKKKTNISKSIDEVNELYKNELGAIVLLTDGNQTLGNDYEFTNSKKKIFPVVFGDTIQYQDIEITQLNANKYSYLKNKFPVEVIVHYKGKDDVKVWYTITKEGKKIFSKQLSFSSQNTTQTIITNIESTTVGTHFYTASIGAIKGEKNTKNNNKSFSVEVIDEQQKGVVLASRLHPDIGAIKRSLESDKKRKVDVLIQDFKNLKYLDYQFFILFQPNNYFNDLFSTVSSNFLVVTGTTTDWNFLNSKQLGFEKKAINQSENYEAFYNKDFLTFQQEDIGFNQFPPLQDKFGKLQLFSESQTLLYQKVTGISSESPLLATFENGEKKYAALFGEGIWKWRANSFLKNNSFEDFDAFLGSLIQYISSNKKRDRLELAYQKIYPANESIRISAFYLDNNYLFDDRASLWITVTNKETKEEKRFPMTLQNNSYIAIVEDLNAGTYDFKVSVDNQSITRYGIFKVTDYEVEEQFINANVTKLKKLAENSNGILFFNSEFEQLKKQLLEDKTYYTIQSSEVTQKNLIDWKWILFLAVLCLSLEWFIRKYYGKI